MAGHVPLSMLLSHILAEHGESNLGDFRQCVLGVFDTTSHQLQILSSTNLVLEKVSRRSPSHVRLALSVPRLLPMFPPAVADNCLGRGSHAKSEARKSLAVSRSQRATRRQSASLCDLSHGLLCCLRH
eukprot:6182438-Pleurochrysis_carterae.AAC.2